MLKSVPSRHIAAVQSTKKAEKLFFCSFLNAAAEAQRKVCFHVAAAKAPRSVMKKRVKNLEQTWKLFPPIVPAASTVEHTADNGVVGSKTKTAN